MTSPGSVVIVASLLEGASWYAALRSAKSLVGILRRAQRLRIIIVFLNLMLLTFLSFLLGFFVSLPPFIFGKDLQSGD
jgi:hypothetical protein